MKLAQVTHGIPLDQIIATILVALLGVAVHRLVARGIKRLPSLSKVERRRWIVTSRNGFGFLIIVVAAVIWLEEIRNVATAAVVIAAALVIATKELLLNVLGYLHRTGAKFFSIGDRIEIEGVRGDVIDQGVMGVTVLEIGPGHIGHQYTGRGVFIPNARFLSAPVFNEAHLEGYAFHIITIPLSREESVERHESALLEAARMACEPHLEAARRHMQSLERQHSLHDAPSVEPRVHVQLPEAEKVNLLLRVPVLVSRKGRLEQQILRHYLQAISSPDPGASGGA